MSPRLNAEASLLSNAFTNAQHEASRKRKKAETLYLMGKQTMYTKLVGDKHPSLLIIAVMVYGNIDKKEENEKESRWDERRAKKIRT